MSALNLLIIAMIIGLIYSILKCMILTQKLEILERTIYAMLDCVKEMDDLLGGTKEDKR